MAIYKCEILLQHGSKKKLAEELEVSQETIKRACKFLTNSETANRIRKAAIEKYNGKLCKIQID